MEKESSIENGAAVGVGVGDVVDNSSICKGAGVGVGVLVGVDTDVSCDIVVDVEGWVKGPANVVRPSSKYSLGSLTLLLLRSHCDS